MFSPPRLMKKKTLALKTFSLPTQHVFFGYYDISPLSADGQKLLSVLVPEGSNCTGDLAQVGYFDMRSKQFVGIGETKAWNWQAGCRLQWLSRDSSRFVAYNHKTTETYETVIYDLKERKIFKKIQQPIYIFSHDGNFGLSFNFDRLAAFHPGYGYESFKVNSYDGVPGDDGVWFVDTNTGEKHLLVSLRTLSEIMPVESMRGAVHFVNLLLLNPSSTKCAFLHRWQGAQGRQTRLMVFDLQKKKICLLEGKEQVSHITWKSDDEILATASNQQQGTRYYQYDVSKKTRTNFLHETLISDGHPSYSSSGAIVTDSRPNELGERELLLVYTNGVVDVLATFYNPHIHKNRCDLHPRWSADGEQVIFDSIHTGLRSLNILNIN